MNDWRSGVISASLSYAKGKFISVIQDGGKVFLEHYR